jgi:hypothetical protein
MFLQYIDFIFVPFRSIRNKWLGIKNIQGNFKMDVNRVKNYKNQGKRMAADANKKFAGYNAQYPNGQPGAQPGAQQQGYPPQQQGGYQQPQQGGYPQQQAYGQQAGYQQGAPMQQPGMPGAPGMPPGPPPGFPQGPMGAPQMPGGAPNPAPPIRTKGFWIFKKKFCSQCEQQLDKTWDACPYCAQMAIQAAQAPAKLQKLKTQAFVLDSSGGPGSVQLLGWLVPLQGANRGELFTLQPKNVIGNGGDPSVTLVLNDKFMSGKHAEIVAEQGLWILRDVGSTNGTYVNNRRIDRHELVDNDFIKFGSAMVKFKSL